MLTITNEDNMQLMARYPDKYFDLAIVDPPYGIGASKRKGSTKNGKYLCGFDEDTRYKISNWDNETPKKEYFEELFRISKNQIVWGGNYFELPISRGWIFWDKVTPVPNYSDGELAWTSFDKVLKKIKIHWMGKLRTGIERDYKCIHPTQKPIKLYKFLLEKYANQGDKILDTHLGSGSIAIACHDYGFDLTACELDKEYYDKAMQRIKEHDSQQKLF